MIFFGDKIIKHLTDRRVIFLDAVNLFFIHHSAGITLLVTIFHVINFEVVLRAAKRLNKSLLEPTNFGWLIKIVSVSLASLQLT